jgi:hypothetical protein
LKFFYLLDLVLVLLIAIYFILNNYEIELFFLISSSFNFLSVKFDPYYFLILSSFNFLYIIFGPYFYNKFEKNINKVFLSLFFMA